MDMQKFVVPEGTTGVSYRGQSYEVTDGIVELPADSDVQDLKAHGLHVYSPSTPAATLETGGTGPDQGAASTNAPASGENGATGAVTPPWASK